jgi:hypothetical protein
MISYRRAAGIPCLRLHESFALADERLKNDLSAYISKNLRRAPDSVREFVRSLPEREIRSRRTENLTHRGRQCNLRTIYRRLNRIYFHNLLKGKTVWGRKIFSQTKQTIIFGSYFPEERTIRIHPVLDTELVPPFYLEAVMHHEMVHEYLDRVEKTGRKIALAHSKRFKELERQFRFHALANAWEKRHFEKLLSYNPGKGRS